MDLDGEADGQDGVEERLRVPGQEVRIGVSPFAAVWGLGARGAAGGLLMVVWRGREAP